MSSSDDGSIPLNFIAYQNPVYSMEDLADSEDSSPPSLSLNAHASNSRLNFLTEVRNSLNSDIETERDSTTDSRSQTPHIWVRIETPEGPDELQQASGCDEVRVDIIQGESNRESQFHYQSFNSSRQRGRRKTRTASICRTSAGTSDASVDTNQESVPRGPSSDEKLTSTDSHCHSLNPKTAPDRKARRKLILAGILCLLFMSGEMAGGLIAGSLAIISDAAHLLTDFASFMISLMALYLAQRPATKKLSFGWYRIEILGALLSILMLWVLTGILVYSAAQRIISDDYEINATIMLITAATGVAFNIVLGTTLHQHTHSHGGGHGHSHGRGQGHSNHARGQGRPPAGTMHRSHSQSLVASSSLPNGESARVYVTNAASSLPSRQSYGAVNSSDVEQGWTARNTATSFGGNTDETSELLARSMSSSDPDSLTAGDDHHHHHKGSNINVKAAFVHVLGDLMQSVGVLVAAFIIYFKPEWKIADPICTFLFSLFVLITTITILRDILVVLMEGTPRGINFAEVREAFFQVDGVLDIHNLRVWSLTMDKIALSVHIAVDKTSDPHDVLRRASSTIQSKFAISETTMQIEEYVTEMDDCADCQGPKL